MNVSPKVVVFAYSEVGARCLETLVQKGVHVVAVFTHEDDPNEQIWFRSVADIASQYKLSMSKGSLASPESILWIQSLKPDIAFSFYYREMIPPEVLALFSAAYNIHGSLLPKFRGRACVNWAVIMGETETGVTLHKMTEKADQGAIVAQKKVSINFHDTVSEVFQKIVDAAAVLLADQLPSLLAGNARLVEQKEADASYYPRRTPEDGQIDWSQTPITIYNLIRGVSHPFPGAFTYLGGKKIFVWKALPREGHYEGEGAIVSLSPLLVACGGGVLELLSLQDEGGSEVGAKEYAQNSLRLGQCFD